MTLCRHVFPGLSVITGFCFVFLLTDCALHKCRAVKLSSVVHKRTNSLEYQRSVNLNINKFILFVPFIIFLYVNINYSNIIYKNIFISLFNLNFVNLDILTGIISSINVIICTKIRDLVNYYSLTLVFQTS